MVVNRAISPLLRSDFAQSPPAARRTAISTDSFVPSDGRAVPPKSSPTPSAAIGLWKVADMHANPTSEPTGSPVPGVIPEPIRVREDPVTIDPAPSPRRRNPVSKLLSALRGDKYMVDAYPPGEER